MKSQNIANALGLILIGFGIIILSPIVVAVVEREYSSILPFMVASTCSIALGVLLKWRGGWINNFDNIRRTDGLLIVSLTWVVTGVIGAIPYVFYGIGPLDAYFESISGLTTTGATILTDFSLYPKDFFFWRSLSQWLGGMGIIVLFIAILPQFAVAGRKIFFAEAPGPTEEKITPRIASTAKALWSIYVILTVLEIVLLYFSGMPLFDALCNSLSTMAAGGFSPHSQSIMGYNNPAAVWIITFFMFLAGSNFALQFRFFVQMKPKSLLNSDEFKLYITIISLLSLVLCCILYFSHNLPLNDSLRDSVFQVVSIITTTGFSSADFALWLVPAQAILLIVMFVGGCAGSAGGGIKVVRILFAGRYLKREIAQTLHPQAIIPLKIDRITIPKGIQQQMIGFLLFYILIMIVSGIVVTMIEGNAITGFIGTAATIGNIGPGFGEIGPMGSFGELSAVTKIIFIIDMVVGRLELIPFLAMLHPDFWGDLR
jgi:trk system potassium uptake protein